VQCIIHTHYNNNNWPHIGIPWQPRHPPAALLLLSSSRPQQKQQQQQQQIKIESVAVDRRLYGSSSGPVVSMACAHHTRPSV